MDGLHARWLAQRVHECVVKRAATSMCRAIAQVKLVLCTVMLQIRAGLLLPLVNNTIEGYFCGLAKLV